MKWVIEPRFNPERYILFELSDDNNIIYRTIYLETNKNSFIIFDRKSEGKDSFTDEDRYIPLADFYRKKYLIKELFSRRIQTEA